MHRTLCLPVVCLLLLPAANIASAAQEIREQIRIVGPGDGAPIQMLPPGRQPKTGTARMRGRVVALDTGTPVRRAQVRISGPDIGSKTALTDAQGRFEFSDLPAGRFQLSASKSGFVTMQFGQTRPFESGKPVDLTDGQVMDKTDFALPRGSVLAGRVTDEFGEPVAEAEVTAMRLQFTNGRRRLVPSGRSGTTNDLGQFRIYGLPPGEYYVSASLRNANALVIDMLGGPGGGPQGSNQASGYAATYYPATPSPAEAQRVAVAVGQELASVDIQLQPVKLAKITGTVVGSDGKPMSGAMVMLMPTMRDAMQFMPGGTSRTNKDGQFTMTGVAPGDYTLQAQSMGGIIQAAGAAMSFTFRTSDAGGETPLTQQEPEFATASVSVAGEDITGMVLVGTRGAKAIGMLAFEGGAKPEGAAGMRVVATPTDDAPGPVLRLGGAPVKEDGAFEIEGLVGTRIFRVVNPPKGWMTKRVTLNGEDVTDRGVEFRPGQEVSGLEIELTNKTTTIAGGVSDARGQATKDYTVVVFAEDQDKWVLPQNRWTASARPDQDGRFKVSNLPPGAYYAIAVEYVAQGEWGDPEWLARAAKRATRFTLEEGASKTLDLKLSGG
jgi:protocatechuate 3,4-dioxygenase beta subunit